MLLFDIDNATGENEEEEQHETPEVAAGHEIDSQTDIISEAMMAETNPFRKGVYKRLLERTARRRSEEDEVRRRGEEHRRTWLVAQGVDVDLAQRMPSDANEPYPDTLRRAVDKCANSKRKAEEQEKERKAEEIFKDTWLQAKEKELVQLSKDLDTAGYEMDRDQRSAMEYCLEVLVEAIRLHHRSAETDPAYGTAMRRKLYVENGWIAQGQEETALVNLYAPPCLLAEWHSTSQSSCETTNDELDEPVEPSQTRLPPEARQMDSESADLSFSK